MKWFLSFTMVLSCLGIFNDYSFCAETYFINNHPVLLYKIINCWYDCLPEESGQFCGSLLRCQNEGNAQSEYNEAEMMLKIRIKGGFAGLLSVFKECERCFGPSYLKCTWINEKYFGNGKAAALPNESAAIDTFIVHNIHRIQVRRIQRIEKDIVFELEGLIGGLLNGKIALHRAGSFIKSCPASSLRREEGFPISLKIINSHTTEVLATYSAIMAH